MKKYFSIKSADGKFINYFQDGDGILSKAPVVYENKRIANRKAELFNATVVEVIPTHAVVDENDKPFIYFLTEESYNELMPQLNLIPDHKAVAL